MTSYKGVCNKVPLLEKVYGIDTYYTVDVRGIGGRIRSLYGDFIVEEISLDGFIAKVKFNEKGDEASCKTEECHDIRGSGAYVWFVLEKKGLDTVKAVRRLARLLKVDERRFSFAGLKDSKAITAQFVSCLNVSEDELRKIHTEQLKVHTIFRRPFPLKPGLLSGNRFTIKIRNIDLPKDDLAHTLSRFIESVRTKGGIPAYYGHQRFGTIRPNTHLIGLYILKGDFEEAFHELVCKYYPLEPEHIKEAKELVAKGDLKRALTLFPKAYTYERSMIQHLLNHRKDYIGAFRRLPLEVRRLFIQALQAYLFNRVLSRRIIEGLPLNTPIEGDYVAFIDKLGRVASTIKVTSYNKKDIEKMVKKGRLRLVLNVIGYNTILAGGLPGEIEREVLESEGIKPEEFKVKHFPEASAKGYLREGLMEVKSFKVLSIAEDPLNKGKNMLAITFTLGKGFYATVLLRELMKPTDIVSAGF
ncbi:MAG: tRNA pseudouridine(13) synthase TruD [Thermoproteales archaeon]|nr:tRNA pseudouridine(13) synthase TruD [Thermoproteales archaeon]RLE64117.1 MAG: tRNA pseudouridine(13) synthase TruD [Thermoprotei archaeon]